MSKVFVSQEKFDQAGRLYGYETARNLLMVQGTCPHYWHTEITKGHNPLTGYEWAYMHQKCDECGDIRDHLNLFD